MQKIGMDAVIMYLWAGTRGSEIFGMNVEHLAEKDGVLWWTIPKAMTKNARFPDATDLRVPLIGRAREVAERRWQFVCGCYGQSLQHTHVFRLSV